MIDRVQFLSTLYYRAVLLARWWRGDTLSTVRERAALELLINPTITVYTFEDGVEHRQSANPIAQMRAAMELFAEAGRAAGERFREAFGPLRNAYTIDGLMTLRSGWWPPKHW